jgi:hypothetical protein
MVSQANAASDQAELRAQANQANADLALGQSVDDERQLRIQAQKQIGRARAQYGAAGVQLDGSAMDILAESAANMEQDALRIRAQGVAQYNAYRKGASLYLGQADAAQANARWGAAATLLKTGSDMYSMYSGPSTYQPGGGGLGTSTGSQLGQT